MSVPATARFSDDGETYADDGRYRLWLDIALPFFRNRTCAGLMMNPSTARVENGHLISDPTVARLIGFARRERCDRLIVVNVLGLRLTDSKQLVRYRYPASVGNPLNDVCIREAFTTADVRIVAWGKMHKMFDERVAAVRTLLRDIGKPVYALKINSDGGPGHPLYLPSGAELREWRP